MYLLLSVDSLAMVVLFFVTFQVGYISLMNFFLGTNEPSP